MKNHAKFFFCACVFACLSGCAGKKPDSGGVSAQDKNSISAPDSDELNGRIQKLAKVLSNMSDRAKEAIPNGNPAEFLSDLDAVLASKSGFSSDDISPFVLVDKKHCLPDGYVPKNLVSLVPNDVYKLNKENLSLRPEAFSALESMCRAAKDEGVVLTVSSTYRSYEYQKNLFDYWVQVDGLEEAERESARAGTSQHQLGMAVDFAPVSDNFAETPAGRWMYENAFKYGWSLSFPHEYEDVTGYKWESWHFRYIGEAACEFQKKWFGDVQQFMIEFLDAWKK